MVEPDANASNTARACAKALIGAGQSETPIIGSDSRAHYKSIVSYCSKYQSVNPSQADYTIFEYFRSNQKL
jgi:hypothetical protein